MLTAPAREVARRSPAMFDRDIETMPREALASLQLERLRSTVRNAWVNVPLLRQRLDVAGVNADDLRSIDHVRRLPFTFKSDLRDQYPWGLLARPRERLARVHASSGTTGKPTVVAYTANDLATWSALMARSLATAGARAGDLDQVTVEIEALAGVERSGYEALRRHLIHHVKSTLGITVDVVVKPPGSLKRAQGKAQRVRDLRPH